MNSVDYQQILENYLLPYYYRFPQKNFIFQQENAVIHHKGLVSAQEQGPCGLAVSVTGPKSHGKYLGNIRSSSLCPQQTVFLN
uniref:Ubiquitinyl hydrolase 1 n=1 Tax=Heterorhabditis bacteriophora TaxID=37862 RepID=A0A1I7XMK6_HETBA